MKRHFIKLKYDIRNVKYYHSHKINIRNIHNIIKNERAKNTDLSVHNNPRINEKKCVENENFIYPNINIDIKKNKMHIIDDQVESIKYEEKEKEKENEKIKLLKVKNVKLLTCCIITTLFFYFTLKKVPEGYVCLVQNKYDGKVIPYIYDDLMTFFFNPLKYKVIHMRIIPIQRKYTNVYETLDKQKIKVKLEVKMKPKIPFIIDIYSTFGINYSTSYIEKEMNFDLKNVIKYYNLNTLLENNQSVHDDNATVDDAIDQIMDRFYDSSIFHKIILMDVTILFEKVE
ncbi:prohibitin-like protein, putative [Plasmodium reichenowi]|uniref:Prohibitin-like protein, putative n=1 Tax=Plasmodium reichenowi TaxID=5854 RepID=A0A060RTB1_PLARE|nr:prohibitin-like protein, putative [Plasmodium reichenowi]KYO02131.1 prohibitin-like protein, putative [Plasmodium reichenowi]CDO62811.1 prohibitin-like protein, putative [Plasmodium reichenowi]SOV76442.1 prohibitin-like protein, putative [Plasmodium reichenowi]